MLLRPSGSVLAACEARTAGRLLRRSLVPQAPGCGSPPASTSSSSSNTLNLLHKVCEGLLRGHPTAGPGRVGTALPDVGYPGTTRPQEIQAPRLYHRCTHSPGQNLVLVLLGARWRGFVLGHSGSSSRA
eukprot:1971474-Rhodomonas_salina.1